MKTKIGCLKIHWLLITCFLIIGCGEDIRVTQERKAQLIRWNLPKHWVENFDQTANFKNQMKFTATVSGRLLEFNLQFFPNDQALLAKINQCRVLIDLAPWDKLNFNIESNSELTSARLYNLRMISDANGSVEQVTVNRARTKSVNQPSHLYLNWVRYDDQGYWLTWCIAKSDQFWPFKASLDGFCKSYDFPRLSYSQRQKAAYPLMQLTTENIAFKAIWNKQMPAHAMGNSAMSSAHGPGDGHGHSPATATNPSASGQPRWVVPQDWVKQKRKSKIGYATFFIQGNPELQVKVTSMAMPTSMLVFNYNRWRKEVGLPQIKDISLQKTTEIKLSGFPAKVLAFHSDKNDPQGKASHVVYIDIQGQKWFFKLIGPKKQVAKHKAAFDGWIKSIKF